MRDRTETNRKNAANSQSAELALIVAAILISISIIAVAAVQLYAFS